MNRKKSLGERLKTSGIGLIMLAFLIGSCGIISDDDSGKGKTLFSLKSPSRTGIKFRNDIEETNEMNVIIYQDFYSGGGVSIGDINNDGLADVFLTGNMVPAKLYLNKGGLKFRDITQEAGLDNMGPGWYTGTAMADINNDGFLDIYISKSGMHDVEDRKNLLYMNNGDGTFLEKGKEYGIDHAGYAVNAAFFDYDRDGDLDMYLVNQGPEKLNSGEAKKLRYESHPYCGDKLYKNVGERFIDVTEKAGIISSIIGFGHGVATGDINNDGWEDIFVSNDFFEHDYLYFNNGDGTFRETIKESTKHISNFSMGNDLADYDNDGWLDIMTLDMVAEDNRRLKANMGGMNPQKFNYTVELGYHYQYMFNMLHLNNGNETFSEAGQLAGVSNTDWSWGPLFADFDNDGYKDLFIANGIRKDIRNTDWGKHYQDLMKLTFGRVAFKDSEWEFLLSSMPSEKVTNYVYRNNGDLTFSKSMKAWGLEKPSFSNGSAYGDLDNDGDLDLVVNNIDEEAFVYENNSDRSEVYNYLRIKFEGSKLNPYALGTKVMVYHGETSQYQQFYLTRGYRSSMEPIMHFGLGEDNIASKIEVTWPDGKHQVLEEISSNQLITVSYKDTDSQNEQHDNPDENIYFVDATESVNLNHKHKENDFNDYLREVLLPHKMSNFGPGLAVGDVDGDGLEDFYVGGASKQSGHMFFQKKDGSFEEKITGTWQADILHEDMGAELFDADNDGDLDLYVVSGGNEFEPGSNALQDRLYINDSRGNFTRDKSALPEFNISGSKVVPSDYDADGDLDLFIGGRLIPGKYPQPADSYLLKNEDGRFIDITDEVAPDLKKLGMVTSAVWTDYDLDHDIDLVVSGEWMPVTLFNNNNGMFKKVTEINGLENSSGWWWSLAAHDFDGDGDDDIVAGNLGLNYKYKASIDEPFEIYSADFDMNGQQDIVLGYYNNHTLFPLRGRSCSSDQCPDLQESFPTYNEFAVATLQDVYGEHALKAALSRKVKTFASSYLENLGNGQFKMKPFDNYAQLSPQNTIIVADVDKDGNDDILMAGNLYASEVETIRADSGVGIWMKGDGKGNFVTVRNYKSGFFADGDVKDMKMINTDNGTIILVARNNDQMKAIRIINKIGHNYLTLK